MKNKKITKFQPGDVYLFHDKRYPNKNNSVDTCTIRFDRPCIIISTSSNIATIIPLTTKEHIFTATYPIQIEEDKVSYALFNQVTTVDISDLVQYIGTLKSFIYQDLKKIYSDYIVNNNYKCTRSVPLIYNHIDIYRFDSFRIYRQKITGKYYVCVKTPNYKTSILINIEGKYIQKYTNSFLGGYNYDDIFVVYPHLSYSNFNPSDFVCVGFEIGNIETLIDDLYSIFEWSISNVSYIDKYSDITKTICKLFMNYSNTDYYITWNVIADIIANPSTQKIFFTDPRSFLLGFISKNNPILQDRDKLDRAIYSFTRYIVKHIHVLNCSQEALQYMNRYFSNELEARLKLYKRDIVSWYRKINTSEQLILPSYINKNSIKFLYKRAKERKMA